MALHSVHEYLTVKGSMKPDEWATNTGHTGTAVDTQGFDDCLVVLTVGTIATTGTLDVKVQECDTTGGSWSDITGAAFSQYTSASDETHVVGRIHVAGRKRYLRGFANVAAAASEFSVGFILASAQRTPTSQTASVAFNLDPA